MKPKATVWPSGESVTADLIRHTDWAATPLGPMDAWPQALRITVDMTLASPVAAIVLWGPELTQIYNDAWMGLVASLHPAAMGQPTHECFPQLVEAISPTYQEVLEGRGVSLTEQLLPVQRQGKMEDAWWNITYTPVRGESGTVDGIFGTTAEASAKVLEERMRAEVNAALRIKEEQQSFLLKLSDDMRAQPREDAVGLLAVNRLAEHLQLDRCYLAQLFPEEDRTIVGPEYRRFDLAPASGEYRLSDFPEVVRQVQTKTAVFYDVAGDPALTDLDKAALGAIKIGAFVNASVRQGDTGALWSLVVMSTTPRVWTPGEVSLVEVVAERTWAAIERVRGEAELRVGEERYRSLFETISQGFSLAEVVRDAAGNAVDWRLLEMNSMFEVYTGMSVAECVGRTATDVFGGLDPEGLAVYDRVVRTRTPERTEAYFAPVDRWVQVDHYPATGDRFTLLYEDISERKRVEASLRESEERQAFTLRLSDDIRAQPSEDAVGALVVNRLAEHLRLDRCYLAQLISEEDRVNLGPEYRRPDLASLSGEYRLSDFPESFRLLQIQTVVFNDVVGDPALPDADKRSLGAIDLGALVAASVRQGKERVLWTLVAATTTPRVWTPGEVELVENIAERTWVTIERARAEAALRESEERLALAFKTLPVGMAIINANGVIVMSNDVMARFMPTGVMPSRDAARQERWKVPGAKGKPASPNDFACARALRGETVSPGVQMIYCDDHNNEIWTESLSAPLRDVKGQTNGALVVVIDVDRSKRSEEAARASDEQLRLFVDNVQEYALMQTSSEGVVTSWNTGAERMFGYSSAEVLGHSFSLVFTPDDYRHGVFPKELEFVSTGKRNEDARWMVRKDGSRFWARWITEPVYETNGHFRGLAKVMRDETDRRSADEVLRVSLEEKEELLKEVHHRVKNNLQVIVSLLNMQGNQIQDERILAHFQEARNRVLAISAIHEQLYRAESFAGILLTDYARQLVPGLVHFYGLESRIQVNVLGDGNKLELERAVPFGILLNELVSNACKHAFSEPGKGILTTEILPQNPDIVLIVSDNGKGLPKGFDYRKASSLGLKLVHALARQLGGTVHVSSGPGTTVTVRFPANTTKESL